MQHRCSKTSLLMPTRSAGRWGAFHQELSALEMAQAKILAQCCRSSIWPTIGTTDDLRFGVYGFGVRAQILISHEPLIGAARVLTRTFSRDDCNAKVVGSSDGGVTLVAQSDIAAQTPVLLNYGDLSNDALLLDYGRCCIEQKCCYIQMFHGVHKPGTFTLLFTRQTSDRLPATWPLDASERPS